MNPDAVRSHVPRWFATIVRLGGIAILAFGLTGLAAAVVGVFAPWVVVPPAALATYALGRRARVPRARAGLAAQLGAAAMIAVVVVAGGYGFRHRSEHVAINRDPGFYVNAARWLERDGSLEVDARVGPFADAPALTFEVPGVYDRDGGPLHFQGDHLLPVLMAEGSWFGGTTALFAVPIVLGGFALLAVYLLLAARAGALPALVATTALAVSLPFLAFSRDAYTEIPTLALVAFALACLPARGGVPHRYDALLAGLALGALCALRIDAPLLLFAWPFIAALWWRRHRGSIPAADNVGAPSPERAVAMMAVGFSVAAAVAWSDLALRAPEYLDDLGARTVALWLALATTVVAAAVYARSDRLAAAVDRANARLVRSGVVVAGATTAGFVAVWGLRPVLDEVRGTAQPAVGEIQELQGLAIDLTRKYAESSLSWQAWYHGTVALAVAAVGIGLIAARHRPIAARFGPLLATAAPAAVLYLYRPNIFPDHTWVMRRYLPTLSLLVVAAIATALATLPRARFARHGRVGRLTAIGLAGALAVVVVVAPAATSRPVRAAADQHGFLGAIEQACSAMGPDAAAIVLVDRSSVPHKLLPQAFRGFCGLPTAIGDSTLRPSVIRDLARRWTADGRRLHLVVADAAAVADLCPVERVATIDTVNTLLLEQTLTGPPDGYSTQSLTFEVYDAGTC